MSRLRRGDENLHYSDNSHRWIAPPGTAQSVWNDVVRAHLAQHRATMGGPAKTPAARRARSHGASEHRPVSDHNARPESPADGTQMLEWMRYEGVAMVHVAVGPDGTREVIDVLIGEEAEAVLAHAGERQPPVHAKPHTQPTEPDNPFAHRGAGEAEDRRSPDSNTCDDDLRGPGESTVHHPVKPARDDGHDDPEPQEPANHGGAPQRRVRAPHASTAPR